MDDEPPSAGRLRTSIIEEQVHLLDAAMVKLRNCLSQLSDDQLWWRPAAEQNSIANLILHVCGNMTQWIICGVGGAEDQRNRDSEFEATGGVGGSDLVEKLDETLGNVTEIVRAISEESLLAERMIQGFTVTGLGAIVHSVSHFVGHTHQIIQLTRLQLGTDYQFAWSPETRDDQLPI